MRRFLDHFIQDYFINERMYLLDISLKTSALFKQIPLSVPHYYMYVPGVWLICVHYLARHQVATVQCTDSSYLKVLSNC